MKIALKLIVGFLLVSLLVGVAGYIGISETEKIHHELDKVVDETLPLKSALENVKFAGLRIVSSTSEFALIKSETEIVTETETETELIREGKDLYNTNFENYENLVNKFFPEESEFVENIRIMGQKLQEKSDYIIELKEKGVSGLEILEAKGEFEDAEKNFLNAVDVALVHENEELITRQQNVSLSITNSTNIILIVSTFIIIVGIIIGVFIARSISIPIEKLRKVTNEISKGNLDAKIPISGNDEISQLAADVRTMENSLKEAKLDLIKSERFATIGELSARMAHDIRNPLSVIKNSFTAYRRKKKIPLDILEKQIFDMIGRAVSSIDYQIESTLDFVRNKPLRLEEHTMLKILHRSLDAITKSDDIKINIPKNDVKIICDSEQTAIVFENLITNAIQAIGEEKGEISIRFIENDASISIEVEDSGKGINDEDMPKIFEPLFTTKQSGTGLGLASCKKIIAMHNGTINVKNNPTVFSVILPKKVLVQSRQSYDVNK